jgi:energy-coupling factor transporter ATP-binding protein EcfA2
LADEPAGNLDEGTRDEIMALLEELWRERGLTLVIVTHDSPVARRAHKIGQMRNVRLQVRPTGRPGGRGGGRARRSTPGHPRRRDASSLRVDLDRPWEPAGVSQSLLTGHLQQVFSLPR